MHCDCSVVSRLVFAQALGSCAWRGSGSGVTSRPDPTVCGRVCACDEKLGLRPAQSRCAGLAGGCCLTGLVFVSWGLRRPRLSHACGMYVPRCLCSRASPAAARLASSIESAVSITMANIFSLIPLRPGFISKLLLRARATLGYREKKMSPGRVRYVSHVYYAVYTL